MLGSLVNMYQWIPPAGLDLEGSVNIPGWGTSLSRDTRSEYVSSFGELHWLCGLLCPFGRQQASQWAQGSSWWNLRVLGCMHA